MPNEMKYGNGDWPSDSPISGERLSTSGEYTGQHKGTVIQDSLYDADNGAYLRARETVRYGTLTATGAVKEISLSGVTYNTKDKVFENVPSKTESFTFKDGETPKTATNVDGTWSVT